MEKLCKRHPSHNQSKGVCPSCLREKLSCLSASSSSTTNTNPSNSNSSTSSSPDYLSVSNLSSTAATDHHYSPHHHRHHSKIKTESLTSLTTAEMIKPLKKSRSLAFILDEEKRSEKRKKKKKGRTLWSKLMSSSGREEEDGRRIALSKTLKDKYSAKCF